MNSTFSSVVSAISSIHFRCLWLGQVEKHFTSVEQSHTTLEQVYKAHSRSRLLILSAECVPYELFDGSAFNERLSWGCHGWLGLWCCCLWLCCWLSGLPVHHCGWFALWHWTLGCVGLVICALFRYNGSLRQHVHFLFILLRLHFVHQMSCNLLEHLRYLTVLLNAQRLLLLVPLAIQSQSIIQALVELSSAVVLEYADWDMNVL